jgi:3-keto-disaccharide hydrolase
MQRRRSHAAITLMCAACFLWDPNARCNAADPPDAKVNQPPGFPDAVLKQTKPIFDGKSLDGWVQLPPNSWEVKAGAMVSTGAGRGVIYTADDYAKYRLVFAMRHVSGKPDHQACVLVFCTRPEEGKKPLDALGGIQFQPPNGGSWDYRVGKNNAGNGLFTHVMHTALDNKQWNQCELLAYGSRGEARMACCTLGTAARCKAAEVLRFKDPTAGNNGPIGLQVHNAGLHDEYKDLYIEVDPPVDDYLTTH